MNTQQTATTLTHDEEKKALCLQTVYAVLYGWITLTGLWAMGGGQSELLWKRAPLWCVLLAAGLAGALYFHKRYGGILPSFKKDWTGWKWGAGLGLLAGALTLALSGWLNSISNMDPFSVAASLQRSLHFGKPSALTILAILFIATPILEYSTRVLFQPAWGMFGAAFLEALTWGFGLQNVLVFLGFLGFGYVGAQLAAKKSLSAAFIFRAIWTLKIASALLR